VSRSLSLPERRALLLSHQKLAHKFAQKNRLRFQRVHDYDDLFAIAQAAIWQATETYEAELGASFTTYAYTACLNAFRELNRIWKSQRRAGEFLTVSLDELQDENELPIWQPASSTPSPEATVAGREMTRVLEAQLRRLDARSRRILLARFEGGQTLEEIGHWEGVSREYIRQLESGALAQIRQALRMGFPELGPGPKVASKAAVEPLGSRTHRKVAHKRAVTAR
jgi:RNA polymerase sigma factor (sigma-70 family)